MSGRSIAPLTDQIWLNSTPTVKGPGCASDTIDGPSPIFSDASPLVVAVGSRNTGPAPQITRPVLAGDRNMVATVSPMPLTFVPVLVGCETIGATTRTM